MVIGNLKSSLENLIDDIDTIDLGINLNIFTIEIQILFDLAIIPRGNTVEKFLKAMQVM